MCGITGFWAYGTAASTTHMEASCRAMTDTLIHRGPDDSNTWLDEAAGVALGHRRLSIIDLSPMGRQPMHSSCGRYVMVYNGEVYNFAALRQELTDSGHAFNGSSDSEIVLTAITEWGLESAVKRFVGMFAFALWDKKARTMSLVRDRLGIKPLYYGIAGQTFLFGSELKALLAYPEFSPEIDRDALSLFFRHNYIPAPHSIYKGISKLEPGSILTIDPNGTQAFSQYWSLLDTWNLGISAPYQGSETEAANELEALLGTAVEDRMLADVPLGAFLSGGIDSSLITALMQTRSATPVNTYSIGFHDQAHDEARYAAQVARHLGTNHTELYVTPKDLLDTIPRIPEIWDEPFADSSQVPTYCLSKLTRKHVTVSLSGDGGDELFLGYERYPVSNNIWAAASKVPRPLRCMAARMGKALPPDFFKMMGPRGNRFQWRLDGLCCSNFQGFYRYILSHHKDPDQLVIGGTEPKTHFHEDLHSLGSDRFRVASYLDAACYLPDDILTKVDRASMAVGLEARVPLLDHRVVEFAAALPTQMKNGTLGGKSILKNILYKHIPRNLVDRPKSGFSVPIESWLANELRDWCESLLDEKKIHEDGYLDARAVTKMWREYLNGQMNWYYYLWDVLMFQAWRENWR